MDALVYLIPVALVLGGLGLGAFFWSLKSGQFEDMDGAAMRILLDDEAPRDDARPESETEATKPTAVRKS